MPELIPAEPGSPEWLAARRAGVTATDIVTILGLSRRDSVYSLFWRKMQQAPEIEDNDQFRLGRFLEAYVVSRWIDEHGGLPHSSGLYRHSERTWQMATVDRLTGDREPVEMKSWADADKPSWQDGPPPQVRAQVLWQMDTMQVATGHVGVVFLPSGEFRSYTIQHKHEPWAAGMAEPGDRIICSFVQGSCYACLDLDTMRAAGEEFMARLRLELPPPDPDASMATLAAVRARFTRQPDKQAEIDGTSWAAWSDAKDVLKHWESKVREYEISLREQAGEASVLTVDGQPVARRVVSDQNVKAHTRHMDYLTRIKPKGDDDA
jgi:putative phage-type endonuclease